MSEPLRTRLALDAAINVMTRGSASKRWIIVTRALRAALGAHYRGFELREASPPATRPPLKFTTHAAATASDEDFSEEPAA
jgi:hypothetical protein